MTRRRMKKEKVDLGDPESFLSLLMRIGIWAFGQLVFTRRRRIKAIG